MAIIAGMIREFWMVHMASQSIGDSNSWGNIVLLVRFT